MKGYIVRRLLYMIPILIAVNIFTFSLFFIVNSPDDMARLQLGTKYHSPEAIEIWKHQYGYDKPLFINTSANAIHKFTETIFFEKSLKLFSFDFGISDTGRDITYDISQRMWPSLALAIPSLLLGLLLNITFALMTIFFRYTYLDTIGVILCVMMMSVSSLFYIIGGQFLIAKIFKLLPISGYVPGIYLFKFILLPLLIGIISGIGSGVRWYRTLFLEEIHKDYVRMAHAKGLSEKRILFMHILKNALIPILTGIVILIPLLFLGSLLMESFFGIPGLGSYTIDAISQQDFAIVRSMVFLGSFLYIVGLLLTDISYTLVDPRVRL